MLVCSLIKQMTGQEGRGGESRQGRGRGNRVKKNNAEQMRRDENICVKKILFEGEKTYRGG